MIKKKIAVLFGGMSPEHEVSIITGIQIMDSLNKDKYDVIPVYVTKDGQWVRGDESFLLPSTFKNLENAIKNKKRTIFSSNTKIRGLVEENKGLGFGNLKTEQIDIVFPAFHGRYGEDGCIQGVLEMSGIPYVGCDVQASAIGMDKVISKEIAQSIDIPVLKHTWVAKVMWNTNKDEALTGITKLIKFPAFVKPVHLGSSIGIRKVWNVDELEDAIEVSLFYDSKIMVEEALENAKEVNISLLGNNPYEVSVCEMPISSGEALTFEDKYISKKGGSKGMATAQRIIPAPIKSVTRLKIEQYAKSFFAEIGGTGIARIDFLLSQDEKQIYLNEINTLPGSIAFYLWKQNGISFSELVEKLITIAFERSEERKSLITTFKSNILSGFSGAKGVKS